jgi:hypothetical protein
MAKPADKTQTFDGFNAVPDPAESPSVAGTASDQVKPAEAPESPSVKTPSEDVKFKLTLDVADSISIATGVFVDGDEVDAASASILEHVPGAKVEAV